MKGSAPSISASASQKFLCIISNLFNLQYFISVYYWKPFFPLQSTYTVNFDPEIVIVGPDSETGILTQNFTLTYTISSATQLQLNKSLGEVIIRDPFDTVEVGGYT